MFTHGQSTSATTPAIAAPTAPQRNEICEAALGESSSPMEYGKYGKYAWARAGVATKLTLWLSRAGFLYNWLTETFRQQIETLFVPS